MPEIVWLAYAVAAVILVGAALELTRWYLDRKDDQHAMALRAQRRAAPAARESPQPVAPVGPAVGGVPVSAAVQDEVVADHYRGTTRLTVIRANGRHVGNAKRL